MKMTRFNEKGLINRDRARAAITNLTWLINRGNIDSPDFPYVEAALMALEWVIDDSNLEDNPMDEILNEIAMLRREILNKEKTKAKAPHKHKMRMKTSSSTMIPPALPASPVSGQDTNTRSANCVIIKG